MALRLLASLVGLAVVLPTMIWGGVTGAEILVSLVLVILLDEWSRMAVPDHNWLAFGLLLVCGGAVFASQLFALPGVSAWVLVLASMATLIGCMLAIPDTDAGQRAGSRLVAGLVYIPLAFSFVVAVRRLDDGLAWLFLILAVTWMGDTGAYFAGRAFGKHKLFERVSPKKTWEGAIGGMIAAIITVCCFKLWWLPSLSWVHAIALGVILDTVGVLGDLVESMFKRAFGVKDSGWIMPGHGGLLDRVDSLLFTAPAAWVYATVFGLG